MVALTTTKDKIIVLLILLFGCVVSFLSVRENSNTGTFALTCIIVSLLIDKRLPLCLSIVAGLLDCEYTTEHLFFVMLIVSVSCFISIFTSKAKVLKSYRIPVACFALVFILSYLLGERCEYTIACLILYSLIICYTIALLHGENKDALIIYSLVIGGVCMMGIMVAIIAQGGVLGVVRRLQFHENIKVISTALAFPIFHLVWELISNYKNINFIRKIVYVLLILLCLFILILTYARGVILALSLSLVTLIFLHSRKFGLMQFVFLVVLIIGGYIMIDKMSVDADIMFNNLEGGHGRTEIWSDFYNKMREGGVIRLLFGFGPGDLKRIITDIYAHSVILDFFFSFGILGFICFLSFIFVTVKELLKRKNMYGLCLLLLCLAMYFPHGSASTTQFYYLLGLCIVSYTKVIPFIPSK